MSAEMITIIAVGIALAGLFQVRINRLEDRMNERITAVEQGITELRERMAGLEGLLEGFWKSSGATRQARSFSG